MYKQNVMTTVQEYVFLTKATLIYIHLWILDKIDFYFKYINLMMPSYVFGSPIINIEQNLSDDSDDEDAPTIGCVFIAQLLFIFKDSLTGKMYSREMHGGHLRPFVNKDGKFFIGELEQYYPDLATIYIRYVKEPQNDHKTSKMMIDVKKRFDNYNSKSYKLGAVL